MTWTIVARKTIDDLLLNEDAARFTCSWEDLRSLDNQQIRIEWSAQVVCVDSPADRALLTERFFSASDVREITPTHVGRFLTGEVATAIKRYVLAQTSDHLIDGSLDLPLSELLSEQCRKAAFAAGMAILPPFTLKIDSPSLERLHKLSQVQERLDAITQTQTSRATTIAELTRRLRDAGSNPRALEGIQLSDPLDLYRAAGVADGSWSSATPSLQVTTGATLTAFNPQRPTISPPSDKSLSDVGPIRSIRPTRFRGNDVVALGAREGIALVNPATLERLASFRHSGASEFGFNAAGVLEEDGRLIATHSDYGTLAWDLARPGDAKVLSTGASRSLIVLSSKLAVFAEVNVLKWIAAGREPEQGVAGTSMIVEVAELPDKLLAIAYADRSIAIVDANAGPKAEPINRVRMLAPIVSLCGLDVCGLPRVLATMTDGTLRAIDPFTGEVVSVGPANYAARAVRTRPGWIALLGADRTRVGLIDLMNPGALASEIHVTASLGNRVADLWFA
jgi:type IV secretory pathway TrbD component